MRISPVENLRVPEEGSSTQGKSGPKPRPKGVSDGQQVDIPVLSLASERSVDAGGYTKRVKGRARPST